MTMNAANFRFDHDLGPVYGLIGKGGLQQILLPRPGRPAPRVHMLHSAPNVVLGRTLQLAFEQYFNGVQEEFAGIPVDLSGGTPFQQAVWKAARGIPWGTTVTYAELAAQMGRPSSAARAVGQALAANPVPVVVPCHRVVGRKGRLIDYVAGVEWKRRLLGLENVWLA